MTTENGWLAYSVKQSTKRITVNEFNGVFQISPYNNVPSGQWA